MSICRQEAWGLEPSMHLIDSEIGPPGLVSSIVWCPYFDLNEVFCRTKAAHHHICFTGVLFGALTST